MATLQSDELLELEREYCSSLTRFVRRAWHTIEPGNPYIHGWHVDAICEHLEAVTAGQINRLVINIPPGTMKSTLTSIMWPAWEWGPAGLSHHRVISCSHEIGLATRDTRKCRNMIASEWFQSLWPLKLSGDQNEKRYFENANTGFRQASAVVGMTGKRGHRVIWDDPHSVEGALSIAKLETTARVFSETLTSRMISPEHSAIVITMQRLSENDVTALAIEQGYHVLCLPMEYEPERKCRTVIGFEDPRTVEGDLLFPERFPRHVVDRDNAAMGAYAVAGQQQQRPAPRTGGFFAWERLEIARTAPARYNLSVVARYWDKAGTADAGAYTAGVKLARDRDGRFWVLDVVRGQWPAAERERVIRQTAQSDGAGVQVWIEQEPGSGGKESAESTIRSLAGYTIRAERPTGEKTLRAEPYSVQVEAGNVVLLQAPWNAEFIGEHKTFPRGKYKDQIDATSGAFAKCAAAGPVIGGVRA